MVCAICSLRRQQAGTGGEIDHSLIEIQKVVGACFPELSRGRLLFLCYVSMHWPLVFSTRNWSLDLTVLRHEYCTACATHYIICYSGRPGASITALPRVSNG
jgi:hypothetical protein